MLLYLTKSGISFTITNWYNVLLFQHLSGSNTFACVSQSTLSICTVFLDFRLQLQATIAIGSFPSLNIQNIYEEGIPIMTRPDQDYEAVGEAQVPDMLTPQAIQELRTSASNTTPQAPEALAEGLIHEDTTKTFTVEEQLIFAAAFKDTPKAFGKIAAVLPGRSVKDCVRHYYSNKGDGRFRIVTPEAYTAHKARNTEAAADAPEATDNGTDESESIRSGVPFTTIYVLADGPFRQYSSTPFGETNLPTASYRVYNNNGGNVAAEDRSASAPPPTATETGNDGGAAQSNIDSSAAYEPEAMDEGAEDSEIDSPSRQWKPDLPYIDQELARLNALLPRAGKL